MDTLKTILYFSIFNYPLKLEEICNFSLTKDCETTRRHLDELVAQNVIVKVDDYYMVDANLSHIERRKKGNLMAVQALVKAQQKAKLISKFPFVEAVGVSGSLSKGYYDSNSDIDFFVITKPNKLWLCRTFLMLYKKLFLLNSRKYFCINYFMSSGNLEVEEKNRFTATEIKTLIPFQGKSAFAEFYRKNEWVSEVFGQFKPNLDTTEEIRKLPMVKIIERLLDTRSGNWLDNCFKKITVTFWQFKFNEMTHDDFKIALKSTKNISKHHPLNFQKKVIGSLNEKYEEIRKNHNIVLQKEYV
ncbi:nucleotidyltransferase domain-containing protein [Flavobacterium sp.]|uniref:nucleotidyltransferase domain-containing protein n=1 Tax=Flavobacterium sp. TaxID=239 RepID=UPI0039E39E4E